MLNKILVAVLLFLMLFVVITTVAVKKRPPQKTIVTAQGYSEDTEFYEELSRKNPEIKNIIIDYFKAYTKNQLIAMGEITIKNDLLQKINEQLVLNKIQNIYFSEFTYLE